MEKAVRQTAGVKDVQVNLLSNTMTVDYNEEKVSPEAIIKAVEKAGYGASPAGQGAARRRHEPAQKTENRAGRAAGTDMKMRLVVSLCVSCCR